MKRFVIAAICSVTGVLVFLNPSFASPGSRLYTPYRNVTVMTYNVYFGADLLPLFQVTTQAELLAAVATIWAQVQASDIPDRAAAIAQQIATAEPDLVSLQEAARWSTGDNPAATNVQYDFLQLILDSLPADGAHYAPVVVKNNIDASAPMLTNSGLVYVRLVDRDVILARTDLPPADLKLSNIQAHTFSTLVTVTNPLLGGTIEVPRSWVLSTPRSGASAFALSAPIWRRTTRASSLLKESSWFRTPRTPRCRS